MVSRILLSHRFFGHNSSPYGSFLQTIANFLVRDGSSVFVVCGSSSYRLSWPSSTSNNSLDSFSIRRACLLDGEKYSVIRRACNAFAYTSFLLYQILLIRPSFVTCSSYPPIITPFLVSSLCRLLGIRLIYHVQDIYPHNLPSRSAHSLKPLLLSLLARLDNLSIANSYITVVLSEDMLKTLTLRGASDHHIHVINNPAPAGTRPKAFAVPERSSRPYTKRLIFAGNLGSYQNLEFLADCLTKSLALRVDFEFTFLGDGLMSPYLCRRFADNPRVKVSPFMPFEEAREFIASFDIGVISLRPRLLDFAFPSKFSAYLSLGLPILAFVDENSSLSRMIQDNHLGLASSPSDIEKSVCDLSRILDLPFDRKSISDWYFSSFCFDLFYSKFSALLY